jgi:hypothetical protein
MYCYGDRLKMSIIDKDLENFLDKGLDPSEFSDFSDGTVYHYTKMESFIGMMNFNNQTDNCSNRCLEFWPSHISTMNDPLDGAFFSEIFLERAKRYFKENKKFEILNFMSEFLGREELLSEYIDLMRREDSRNEDDNLRLEIKLLGIIVQIDRRKYVINNSIDGYSPFITSFSMNDSLKDRQDGKLPLWIPYADNARGVRLGFSLDKLHSIVEDYSVIDSGREITNKYNIFYKGKICNKIVKVKYMEKTDIENLVDGLFQKTLIKLEKTNETATVGTEINLENFYCVVSDIVMDYSMVLKPNDYKHEEEVRVILYQPDRSRILVRVGQRGVTPYIEFKVPHKNIDQILFGPAISPLSENFLKYSLGSDFGDIEIKKSGINYRS